MSKPTAQKPDPAQELARLKANEARFRALIGAGTALVWRADATGSVLEGFGPKDHPFRDAYKGYRWIDAVHPEDLPRVRAAWVAGHDLAQPPRRSIEFRIKHADGRYRWARAGAVALLDPDGSIKEWVGTLTDVHDQHEAAAILDIKQERLDLAIEAAGLGLWDHDVATGQTWWSEGKRSVLGLPADQAASLDLLIAMIHPDDRPRIAARIESAPSSPAGHFTEEFRIHRADDASERWISSVGTLISDAQGKCARVIGTVRDITERKLAQERLRSSEERFRRIASSSGNACICTDADGKITFWNDAAVRMFGFAETDALGHPIEMIIPERWRRAHKEGMRRAARSRRYVGRSLELTGRHSDGHEIPVEISLTTWLDQDRRNFGALVRDISERREHEKRLYRLAHYDTLTDLPNRALLWERINEALQTDGRLTLLIVDLDGFKDVNDSMGHQAGDELLKQVGARLSRIVDRGALVARIGGDEFAVFLPNGQDPLHAGAMADRIIAKFTEPFHIGGRHVFLSTSIGIALAPAHGTTAEELMVNADLALYLAKADGRSVSRMFTPNLRAETLARQTLQAELRRALEQGQFEVFYQPQLRISDHAIIGAEALVRWRHPERGILSPGHFLSVLKDSPVAAAVGSHVLETACRAAAAITLTDPTFRIAVNIFSVQLRSPDFVQGVDRLLKDTGLDASCLEIEITENIILDGDETLAATLAGLRRLGVGLAFDDYGTGYASLSMLKQFPLTRLKIDRSFVRNIETDDGDAEIVKCILQLAHSFGLEVLAEGVETTTQETVLAALGCTEVQGFLHSQAVPFDHFMTMLNDGGKARRTQRSA